MREDGSLDYFENEQQDIKKGTIQLGHYKYDKNSENSPLNIPLTDLSRERKDHLLQFDSEKDKLAWLKAMKRFLINES